MRTRSGRKEGTRISSPWTGISSRSRYFTISSLGILVPRSLLIFSGSSLTVLGWGTLLMTSIMPSSTSPHCNSSTSSQARSTAGTVSMGSRCFSNLPDASVRMPRARAVWRMEVPSKLADSKTTMVVSSRISLFNPPIMPARPMGLFSSAMTSIPGFKARWVPSRVVMDSPSRASRTTILPEET